MAEHLSAAPLLALIYIKAAAPSCSNSCSMTGSTALGLKKPMKRRVLTLGIALLAATVVLPGKVRAQDIDFGKIDKFESLSSGTLRVGAPPKTIVDDRERHVVVLTIWDADAETKVYWRSPDGNAPRTTVIPGRGVQTFQTIGEFKLEAVGEPNREVQYGCVLLGLRN
jgi:hypothetical protein